MFLEVGPTSIVVHVSRDGIVTEPQRGVLEERISEALQEIGGCLPVMKERAGRIVNTRFLGPVPRRMVEAATAVNGTTLTPMAAVAGAVSDVLTAYLREGGADFVSVNNGGDISMYTAHGQPVRIGIWDSEKGIATPYGLAVRIAGDWGVATSGFGGRSLTLGLADAVTVLAPTAALADAAATYIGNMTDTETERVIRRRAAEIDPSTDIPDEMATLSVGELTTEETNRALAKGLKAARALKEKGVILGAVILLKGRMATTLEGEGHITLEVMHGSEKDRYDR